jgi:hypothetical protein
MRVLPRLITTDGFGSRDRYVVSGAVQYFLMVNELDHDLTDPQGFEGDRLGQTQWPAAVGQPQLVFERA